MANPAVAQDGKQVLLIDEFDRISCEELLSRVDNFMAEISNRPGSHGVAVIMGNTANLSRNLEYENWIRGNVAFRNFSADRITTVRRLAPEGKVQFLLFPDGVERKIDGETWSLVVPRSTRPFIVWRTNDSGCPGNPQRDFIELLKVNPASRANIVLKGSRSQVRREKRELLTMFSGIERRRLRFFYVFEGGYPFADYELWLVP